MRRVTLRIQRVPKLSATRAKNEAPACEAELLLDKLLRAGFINPLALDALPKLSRLTLASFDRPPTAGSAG